MESTALSNRSRRLVSFMASFHRDTDDEPSERGNPSFGSHRRGREPNELEPATWSHGTKEHLNSCPRHAFDSIVADAERDTVEDCRRNVGRQRLKLRYSVGKEHRAGGVVRVRALATSVIFLGILFFFGAPLRLVGALAPAPHNRACPGPLDGQNAALCGAQGKVSFEKGSTEVLLSRGRVTVWIERLEGFGGRASAQYRVVEGSALAGREFESTQGKVVWESAEAQPKPVSVTLIDSGSYRLGSYRTSFAIELTGASGGAIVGSQNKTVVTIVNTNALPGTLAFAEEKVTVSEASLFCTFVTPFYEI